MAVTDLDITHKTTALLTDVDPAVVDQFEFRGAQFDAGLAWVHFPVGKGGLGATRGQQVVVERLLREAGVKYRDLAVNPIGIGMGAPTVLAYGDEELQRKHLRPIFTGEHIWCQLFSEPGAGSDVAGVQCRAVRDGDEWVVNGQKVWTSLAHRSRYGMLLARTDPDVPKHAGLSYFLLDMHAPGVEVRPLFQITGEAEFNEVFLSDVRIPNELMLGGRGDGWKVATTTLMNERVALSGEGSVRGGGAIRGLMRAWDANRDGLTPHQAIVRREQVIDLWIDAEILRLTNSRAKAMARSGQAGPLGSVGKLMSAELNKRIYATALGLYGAGGMVHPEGYQMTRSESPPTSPSPSAQFLRSVANTIEGGTSEILRNIIGERVLGLPADVRVDKDVPWSELPR
jgi:alkylation response protein AidB-like acyl-CoA dehydrogenase